MSFFGIDCYTQFHP